jgi:hypothetical protein
VGHNPLPKLMPIKETGLLAIMQPETDRTSDVDLCVAFFLVCSHCFLVFTTLCKVSFIIVLHTLEL